MTTHDLPTIPTHADDWRLHKACANAPTILFFPERGGDVLPAKAICATCTVRDDCLRYALEDRDTVGIWGGTSDQERRAIRLGVPVGRPGPAPKPIQHGTASGYNLHRHRGETPCTDCRKANAAQSAANRARRVARRAVAA